MSGARFDTTALKEAFGVAAVLDHFALAHSRKRAPCPLCHTSPASTAFSFSGDVWTCHACGEHGDSIRLYARLAGVPLGRAIAEIASHLGLIESTPAEWDAKRAARLAEAEDMKLASEIEATRWRARMARLNQLSTICFEMPDSPLGWDILGNLYAQIGTLEAWVETRDYPVNGWVEKRPA